MSQLVSQLFKEDGPTSADSHAGTWKSGSIVQPSRLAQQRGDISDAVLVLLYLCFHYFKSAINTRPSVFWITFN